MRSKLLFTLFLVLYFIPTIGFSQNVSDYLILQNIGDYGFITQTKNFITGQIRTIPGYTIRSASGIIAGTDHFDLDHNDKTYETDYVNVNIELAVEVQITQHAGSDSDRWLLHEVEDGYRDAEKERLGLLTEGTVLRKIGTNRVLWIGLGGGSFMWMSGNVVIKISYIDLQGTKSEPLEIVQAYLQKFPSTITLTDTEAKSRAHDEQWIKDEMERRLWLGDKWFAQLQVGNVEIIKVLRQSVDHMNVFLDYREKYYGIASTPEKKSLWEYLQAKDGTSIRNKLGEYKTWWDANKAGAINIP